MFSTSPNPLSMKSLVLTLLLASMAISACGTSTTLTPIASVDSFSYSVRLLKEGTNEYVSSAVATIEVSGLAPLQGVTDTNGFIRFIIDARYMGKPARLLVKANQYEPYRREIDLVQDALPDTILLKPVSPTSTPTDESTLTPTTTSTNTPQPSVTNTPTPKPLPTNTSTPRPQPTTASSPTPSVDTNWRGEYFNNREFLGAPTYTREDATIGFNWEDTNPAPGIGIDNFSIRWTRCLNFEERYYTFSGKVAGNLKAWLDDTELLNIGYSSKDQKYLVTAGTHCLKIQYVADYGNASASFDFKANEQLLPVPKADTNWHGEYFNNRGFLGTPTYVREDATIGFNWEDTNPAPGIGIDNFSIRWTRCLNFEERYYTFSGKVAGNLKAWLDDTELLNIGYSSKDQKYLVTAGTHCLKIQYVADYGNASASFDFKAN